MFYKVTPGNIRFMNCNNQWGWLFIRPVMAANILGAYEGTLEEDFPPESERYEHSEMLLYKVTDFSPGGLGLLII